jgi:hypothetical protein
VSRPVLWTLLLGAIGGFVDAVGFLALFQLFTAHMSGNSVWFGAAFGLGEWRISLHHLFPIPLFVIGVAVGTIAVDVARRRQLRAPFVPALSSKRSFDRLHDLRSAFVVDDAVRPPALWAFYSPAALPVFAMGVQNAALRQVAARPCTHVITGVPQSRRRTPYAISTGCAAAPAAAVSDTRCDRQQNSPNCAPRWRPSRSGSRTSAALSAVASPRIAGACQRSPSRLRS